MELLGQGSFNPNCAQLGIELVSWCYRDIANPVAPQWEPLL